MNVPAERLSRSDDVGWTADVGQGTGPGKARRPLSISTTMNTYVPRRAVRVLALAGVSLVVPAAAHAVDLSYTNPAGIYTVTASDNGNFAAKTGPNHPQGAGLMLTYTQGGRSLIYNYDSSTYYPFAQLVSPKATLTNIPNGVRASGDLNNSGSGGTDQLHVDEDLTVSGTTVDNSAIFIKLKVRNDGASDVDLGARMAVDFKIANDDGPAFTPQGGSALTAATRYTNPSFDYFFLNDNNGTNPSIPTAPTLRATWTAGVNGIGTTPPDILEMADFGVRANTPLVPALPLSSARINADNEVRWIWGTDVSNARHLAPGQTATFSIATSMGALNPQPPTNTTPPSISGTPTTGQTLRADTGTWSDTTGLTQYTYQWYRCDAQGGNCVAVNGATNDTYNLTSSDLGSTMRVDVQASGSAAPVSSQVTAAITAPDSTPPLAPTLTGTPAATTGLNTAEVDFTGAEPGGTFECRVDGGSWSACTSPFTSGTLLDGPHTVDVHQIDDAGNVGPNSTASFTVDTTAPAAPTITGQPSDPDTATTAHFSFTGENGATFEYQLDNGAWAAATSPLTVPLLSLGQHTVKLRQTDAAGNVGPETSTTWTIAGPVAPPVNQPTPPVNQPTTPTVTQTVPTQTTTTTVTTTTPTVETTTTTTPVAAPAPVTQAPITPSVIQPARPRFTAVIAGGGTTTNATNNTGATTTVTVQNRGVDVGCAMTGVTLRSCQVDLYTMVGADGRAVAAQATRRVLVGTGKVEADATTHRLSVRVVLNGTGRDLLRRSKTGFKVRVAITGKPDSGDAIKAMGAARLVAKHTTFVLAGFGERRATLPASIRRQLREIVGLTASGASVRIVGHTDNTSANERYLRKLGLRRASAAQHYLAAHGAKASYKLGTRGDTQPRATNRTATGRWLNRRVVIEVVR
jgi:outer membrane protein OmpA-like peptidoglycan-associated protein